MTRWQLRHAEEQLAQMEDRLHVVEFERDDALARVAQLEAEIADLTDDGPRTFAVAPHSPGPDAA